MGSPVASTSWGDAISLAGSQMSSLARFMSRLKEGRGRAVLIGDPTKEFEGPRYTRPPQQFLYPQELLRFLDIKCPVRESLARDLLLDTMLRVSELANASVGDLDPWNPRGLGQRVGGSGNDEHHDASPGIGTR